MVRLNKGDDPDSAQTVAQITFSASKHSNVSTPAVREVGVITIPSPALCRLSHLTGRQPTSCSAARRSSQSTLPGGQIQHLCKPTSFSSFFLIRATVTLVSEQQSRTTSTYKMAKHDRFAHNSVSILKPVVTPAYSWITDAYRAERLAGGQYIH